MIRMIVKGIFTIVFFPTRAVFRAIDRPHIGAEAQHQETMIDKHIRALEDMGFSTRDAGRIVELKQRELWLGRLTPAEKRELAEVNNRKFNAFRRAAE